MTGFIGYNGGLQKCLKDAKVQTKGATVPRGLAFGVWHVGGANSFKQYKPTAYVDPVVRHAVHGGADRLVYLVAESSQVKAAGKLVPAAGLVGDYDDVCKYIAEVLGKDSPRRKYGVYYKLIDPTVLKT